MFDLKKYTFTSDTQPHPSTRISYFTNGQTVRQTFFIPLLPLRKILIFFLMNGKGRGVVNFKPWDISSISHCEVALLISLLKNKPSFAHSISFPRITQTLVENFFRSVRRRGCRFQPWLLPKHEMTGRFFCWWSQQFNKKDLNKYTH